MATVPEKTGLLLLAMTIPTIILSPLTGRIVAARGARTPTLIGLASLTIGIGILAASDARLLVVTLVALAFLGTAAGTAVAAATTEAMGSISPERSGMASGILSSQRALGSTAGFAIMGSVFAATISITLPGNLEPHISDGAQRQQVVDRVVDDANPHAIAGLIGPGKPLPRTSPRTMRCSTRPRTRSSPESASRWSSVFSSQRARLSSAGCCSRGAEIQRSSKSRSNPADASKHRPRAMANPTQPE